MYINKLNHIVTNTVINTVNKYSNKYHGINKTKPIDAKPSSYFGFQVESNDKNGTVCNLVRISKCKNICTKDKFPNCPKIFVIKKSWKCFTVDMNLIDKEMAGRFIKKNYKRQTKKSLELKR